MGKQVLSIGAGCDRIATIEHEFLHALGFWHEQSRADRDDYVTIMWDRIQEGATLSINVKLSCVPLLPFTASLTSIRLAITSDFTRLLQVEWV